MILNLAKGQIDPSLQYFVILEKPSRLEQIPSVYLPAGQPILVIGSAAIELYENLQQIEAVEPPEAIANGITI